MNYIQAMKLLDNGELNGIYVLSGEEIFLIDRFVELFKENIVSATSAPWKPTCSLCWTTA